MNCRKNLPSFNPAIRFIQLFLQVINGFYNGNKIDAAVNQFFIPQKDGDYQVRVINEHNCNSELSEKIEFSLSGIEAENYSFMFNVFPNPTSGIIKIDGLNSLNSNYTIYLYDYFGKIILSAMNLTSINISGLDNGIYYLAILTNEKTSEFKK